MMVFARIMDALDRWFPPGPLLLDPPHNDVHFPVQQPVSAPAPETRLDIMVARFEGLSDFEWRVLWPETREWYRDAWQAVLEEMDLVDPARNAEALQNVIEDSLDCSFYGVDAFDLAAKIVAGLNGKLRPSGGTNAVQAVTNPAEPKFFIPDMPDADIPFGQARVPPVPFPSVRPRFDGEVEDGVSLHDAILRMTSARPQNQFISWSAPDAATGPVHQRGEGVAEPGRAVEGQSGDDIGVRPIKAPPKIAAKATATRKHVGPVAGRTPTRRKPSSSGGDAAGSVKPAKKAKPGARSKC